MIGFQENFGRRMVQYLGRPWWDWVLFLFAVLGAIKSLIWDWVVAPLLQKPKIVGYVTDLRVVSRGVTATKEKAIDEESVFDSEIRIYVHVFNKRHRATRLNYWMLGLRLSDGTSVNVRAVPIRDLEERKWRIHGALMPETIEFEQEDPYDGWVYFSISNRKSRSLQNATYSLFLVDTGERRHKISSALIPPSSIGAGPIPKNAL